MIDVLHMALGEPMPQSIAAVGGKYWFQDSTETPDTMVASFEYPGLVAVWEHRFANTAGAGSRLMGAEFHGTRGTLSVDRRVLRVTPEVKSDLPPFEMAREADPHPLHWANFLDCVRTRRRPNSEIETCHRSSAACILANLSLRTRRRIEWDEQAQTVSDPDLRPLLRREYRPPWKLEI
jgi:predicted dehydrogenase